MKHLFTTAAFIALAACTPPAAKAPDASSAAAAPAAATPVKTDIPAGTYAMDKTHTNLTFRVNHLGFSNYTAQFTKVDAKLQLDPANPSAATLEATIDPRSLLLNAPPKGFTEEITGAQWLDAKQFPRMIFKSTKIEMTGPDTAKVTGDFTMHGVTAPVEMDVKFNGGWAGFQMDPHARAGFSAHGVLKRSAFGIANGIPAPGTNMGVSDAVEFQIETEMSGPDWKPPAGAPATPAP